MIIVLYCNKYLDPLDRRQRCTHSNEEPAGGRHGWRRTGKAHGKGQEGKKEEAIS